MSIDTVYQEVLGRDADASGRESYAGMSDDEVRAILQNSQEYAFIQRRGTEDVTEEQFKDRWKEVSNSSDYTFSPSLFQKYSAMGMTLDEMAFHAMGTHEAKLSQYYVTPKRRGEEFYASHADTDEFTATREGQIVWLKDVTPVDPDYYEDVTDKYAGNIPSGYKAYRDKGSLGGGGLVESIGSGVFGMNEFDSDSQNFFAKVGRTAVAAFMDPVAGLGVAAGEFAGINEGYAVADAYTLNTGTRIAGGQRMHAKSAEIFTENLGLQEGEWDAYADIGAKVIVSTAATILAPFSVGQSLWMIPAFTALQGTSRRVGGTAAERERESWSDVAENTAWDAAAASIGVAGYGGFGVDAGKFATGARSGAAYGALTTARAKSGGESWSDAAWKGLPAVASGYSPYVGAAASTASTLGRGGTVKEAAIAGGTSVAGYEAGRYFGDNMAAAAAAAMGISFAGNIASGQKANVAAVNATAAGVQGAARSQRYQKNKAAFEKARPSERYEPSRVKNDNYFKELIGAVS